MIGQSSGMEENNSEQQTGYEFSFIKLNDNFTQAELFTQYEQMVLTSTSVTVPVLQRGGIYTEP